MNLKHVVATKYTSVRFTLYTLSPKLPAFSNVCLEMLQDVNNLPALKWYERKINSFRSDETQVNNTTVSRAVRNKLSHLSPSFILCNFIFHWSLILWSKGWSALVWSICERNHVLSFSFTSMGTVRTALSLDLTILEISSKCSICRHLHLERLLQRTAAWHHFVAIGGIRRFCGHYNNF